MSSSEEDGLSSSSSGHSQSAQRVPDQLRLEDEDVESDDEMQSDDSDSEQDATTKGLAQELPDISPKHGQQSAGVNNTFSENDSPDDIPTQTRPNKYLGHASTWRSWTAPERDLMASLDQLTASDLSMHLYNAFKLKKNDSAHDRRRKDGATSRNKLHSRTDWEPPKVWTAWPLPSDIVPREQDGKHWEEESVLGQQPSSKLSQKSEPLRELLTAQILRHARERFLNRESEDSTSNLSESQGESSIEMPARAPNESCHSPKGFKPVVMLDDDRARQILQPTVQHILSKLDYLLMGLHHARSSYAAVDDSAGDYQTQESERSDPESRPRKRQRCTSKTIKSSKTQGDSNIYEDVRSEGASRSKSRRRKSRAKSARSRNLRLGLRDWSDVLGVASMTGWDQDTVERTAGRCASLFGQGIMFRTLEEGMSAFTERSHLPDMSRQETLSESRRFVDRNTAEAKQWEEAMFGGVPVDGFLTPIEGKKSWKYPAKGSQSRSRSRMPRS